MLRPSRRDRARLPWRDAIKPARIALTRDPLQTESRPVGRLSDLGPLLDDLDDPMGSWIDQHGTIVHHGVAILRRAVFARDLVIGHAAGGKLRADPHLALIAIRRMVPLHHVAAETRPRVVGDAARRCTRRSTDRSTDRSADSATDDGASDRAARRSALRHG